MKKLLLFIAGIFFLTSSCKKEIEDPIVTPEDNTWIMNDQVFKPTSIKYYDTAKAMYGGLSRKASVTVRFFKTPVESGKFVFRELANEINEMSVVIVDSTDTSFYVSQDNDGRVLKAEQFADVTVENGRVAVAFNNFFLKKKGTDQWAKVSLVAKP